MKNKQLSPAAVALIVVIVVALVGVIGFQYLNRPPHDPIADAVMKAQSGPNAPAPLTGPMDGGGPHKAGATDYARPPGSPKP